jgi:hypothetical protein
MLNSPKVLSLGSLLNLERSLEIRKIGFERAHSAHTLKEIALYPKSVTCVTRMGRVVEDEHTTFVTAPVRVAFPIPSINIHCERAKTIIQCLVDPLVIKCLAQFVSDNRALYPWLASIGKGEESCLPF